MYDAIVRQITRRHIFIFQAVLLAIFSSSILWGHISLFSFSQPLSDDLVAGVGAHQLVGQSFLARYPGITHIAVKVGDMDISDRNVTLHLRADYPDAPDNVVIRKRLSEIRAGPWLRFHFEPLNNQPSQQFFFFIEADGDEPLWLMGHRSDVYASGELIGASGDLAFQVSYSGNPLTSVWAFAIRIAEGRVGIFGNPVLYLFVLLVYGIVLTRSVIYLFFCVYCRYVRTYMESICAWCRLTVDRNVVLTVWLVVLLWAHGLLYALFLPPWDYVDEEQHFDYIHYLATQARAPIVGHDYLSPTVVEAIINSHRWSTYHWPSPASQRAQDWGLEGQSYEGYQPPLFYLLAVPFYSLSSSDPVSKLFALRLLLLFFSPALLLMMASLLRKTSRNGVLDTTAWVLLTGWVMSTDRAMMMVRLNNDWLAWVLGVALVWVAVNGIQVQKPRWILMWAALLCAAGLLTKLSFVVNLPIIVVLGLLLRRQYTSRRIWLKDGLGAFLVVVVSAGSILIRNLSLYGDLTGISIFMAVAGFQPQTLTPEFIVATGISFIQAEWVTWWHGLELLGVFHWGIVLFDGVNSFLILCVALGCGLILWKRKEDVDILPRWVWASMGLVVLLNVSLTFLNLLSNLYPLNQSRFMTTVDAPVLLIMNVGLRRAMPEHWRISLAQTWLVLLVIADTLYLLFYVGQYFYS